jgi:GT2 family glycosyltransferase
MECLASLVRQSFRGFEIVVVDNSGKELAKQAGAERFGAVILEQKENTGFGAAVNAGFRHSRAPLLATINDDAVAHPDWLKELVAAAGAHPEAGMFASRVLLAGDGRLDSAGMLISGDGTSKQRGHMEPPGRFLQAEEVLLPSGSAALYRRAMLDEIGMFDEDFFLYCEDTDLGLRGRWAGWKCMYVPAAQADHAYSTTAGRASALKAYYVERNRLCVLLKNFPAGMVMRAPLETASRYMWHCVSVLQNRGAAARFTEGNHGMFELAFIVARAHVAVAFRAIPIWKKRRAIRKTARLSAEDFRALLGRHWITARQVAAL